jgi:RecA/RadA recombinase
MVARRKARHSGGDYFPALVRNFIPSGCTLLDCVLGGGWVLGRVSNIVGDKSTGKTLLAIEACANFARVYPKGKIYYREAEAAFDPPYAARLGLPLDRVDFGPQGNDTQWRTIEDIFSDLRKIVEYHIKHDIPGLYIIDSLDALSSKAALAREVGEGSFNLEKQKILAQLFEQLVGEFKASNLCILIISQVRDKIGFVVGEKHRRSGGRSLDFYASHILWLAHIKNLVRTIGGIKRATGIKVLAHAKKNKVTVPFGKCVFPIRFGFGVDDVVASIEWLVENKKVDKLGIKLKEISLYVDELDELSNAEYAKRADQIRAAVIQSWAEIDETFAPKRKKYS